MGNESQKTSAAKEKKSSRALVTVILLSVMGGAAGAWYYVHHSRFSVAAQNPDAATAPKYVVPLDGFTVNLADPEDTHFLRVTMDLGIDRLPDGADREKAASSIPTARVRDAILSVLTVCKADPLLTPEGKAQLKQNLIDSLRRKVPELDVRDVYFTEFLVQR
jgi:flagellar FliL protein